MKLPMIIALLAGFSAISHAENTFYTKNYREAVKLCGWTKVRSVYDAQGTRLYYCAYSAPKHR